MGSSGLSGSRALIITVFFHVGRGHEGACVRKGWRKMLLPGGTAATAVVVRVDFCSRSPARRASLTSLLSPSVQTLWFTAEVKVVQL